MRTLLTLEQRLWQKVNIGSKNDCWEWTKPTNNGYGRLCYKGKGIYAHRLSYEIFNGEVPIDLEIDHLCRNRRCVNPKHLEAVTSRENTLRGETEAAKNALKTHCPKGHEYSRDNTYLYRNRRNCRQCHREKCLVWLHKKKLAVV